MEFFDNCQIISTPFLESTGAATNTRLKIFFVSIDWYHSEEFIINDHLKKKICSLCPIFPTTPTRIKFYKKEEPVLMDTSIEQFHKKIYITDLKNPTFNLPHICILVTHYCGKEQHSAFQRRGYYQYIKFCYEYTEILVSRFKNQIQSE